MAGKSDLFFFPGGHVLVAPSADGRGVAFGFCQGSADRREEFAPARAREIGECLIRCADEIEPRPAAEPEPRP